MKMLILIHAMVLFLLLLPSGALSFEYDVDWPTSDGRKQTSTLVITIDGCETKFTMKNSDIEKFRNDKENLKTAVKIAIQNAETGCKR